MPRLLSVNSYHYRRGGADVVYLDHAELFESLGWENAFFAMHHPKNLPCPTSSYFVDEIQIGHQYTLLEKVAKATKVVYSFEAQRKIRKLIADFRPDIAHIHNIYHHISPSILPVLREAGVPVVLTAHDLKIACPNNKMLAQGRICEKCKGGRYYEVIKNRCVQDSLAASAIIALEATVNSALHSWRDNVDIIVVPSRFFIDKFVEWGWPRDRFVHIPNYVDAEQFAPAFEPGGYFVYFGRLSLEKGLPTLIRAVGLAGVKLVVVGTGPIEADLMRLAEQTKADIQFAGYQTGAALHELIRGSRASVLASEWYENAPLGVLESFALGKPVIGARIGGIPELVRDGQTGWLFESGDHEDLANRLRLAHDMLPHQIAALGRACREALDNEFNRSRYVRSMIELYHSVGVSVPPALEASIEAN